MRRVMVKEWVKGGNGVLGSYQEKYEATFHGFGCDYEEFETGAGNYSSAIIERDDGVVGNVPASHIRFIIPTITLEENTQELTSSEYHPKAWWS